MAKTDTPAMRQWRRAKKAHPDALILYRMGDFYELFHEDAEKGAAVLGLTLTERNNGAAAGVPMAGFPHKAREEHIAKLVRAGERVAILEQVEDPSNATGLVKRAVTDVITPGVVLEGGLLEAAENNFVASLWDDGRRCAVGAVDASTGEVLLIECEPEEVDAALTRLSPSEILLAADHEAAPPSFRGHVTRRAAWYFDRAGGEVAIREAYGVEAIEGLGFAENDAGLVRAFGATLTYLDEVRPSGYAQLQAPTIERAGAVMWLDRMTVQNLELLRPIRTGVGQEAGTLISVLDHTRTPMGGRMLRRWIREPLLDPDVIGSRQDGIEHLVECGDARRALGAALGEVRDLERLGGRVASGRARPRELRALADSLVPLPEIPAILVGGREKRGALDDAVAGFDDLADLKALLCRALPERPAPSAAEGAIIRSGYDAALDDLRSLRDSAKDRIAEIQARERERTGIGSLKVGFNKVHGYYLEVTKANLASVPHDYERRQTLANSERYITAELKELEERITGAAAEIEQMQVELFAALRDQVGEALSRLLETARRVALLDVIASLASVAQAQDYVRPVVEEGYPLDIQGGRHPVVETMMPPQEFITNDITLNGEHSTVILTGPNMGGKSTLLRQVGLIQLMAQMGSFVPADSARLGVCDRIFTRVGASDDLVRGQSTFMVEMTELGTIVHGATARSLVLIDEVGRGTSTYDGAALAWASVEYITERVGAKLLFATHYHELTDLADRIEKVVNRSMAAHESNGTITFLHRLVRGPAEGSMGIQVGRLAGLPQPLLQRAQDVLATLDQGDTRQTAELAPVQFGRPVVQADAPLERAIDACDLNSMTPLEALNMLAELKEIRRAGSS